MTAPKLTAAVQAYLADLRAIRATGGATGELSYHTPLSNLLTAVGATLKPRVRCVGELQDMGAGHLDLEIALTACWEHLGRAEAVMPGQGRAIERPYTTPERAALPSVVPALSRNPVPVPRDTGDDAHTPGDTTTPRTEDDAALPPVIPALSRNPVPVPRDTGDDAHTPSDPTHTPGDITFDIYLNDRAYWRNVPAAVWNYKLGGYQVLKKWLSYREHKVLHRPLHPHEVQHFTNTARRITAILKLVDVTAELR